MAPPPGDDGRLDWLKEDMRSLASKMDTLRDELRMHIIECTAGREEQGRQIRKLFSDRDNHVDSCPFNASSRKIEKHLKDHGLEPGAAPDPWVANEATQAWAGRRRIAGLLVALLTAIGWAGAPFLLELMKGWR